MTLDEALALATRALRRGSCSTHRTVNEPCATCDASDQAINILLAVGQRGRLHRIRLLCAVIARDEGMRRDRNVYVRAEGYAAGVIAERGHTVHAIAEREVQRCRAELAERSLATTIHELAERRAAERPTS